MKTVILMRHAKSGRKNRDVDDHDRPLKKRGRKAAPVMARWLEAQGPAPGIVLCSSSRRTRETVERMRDATPGLPEPEIRPSLYEAGPAALLDELKSLPDDRDSALLVGHQPGLGELLDLLVREVRDAEDRRAFEKFPTAAIAILRADVASWRELGPDSAELTAFAVPRGVTTDPAASS